MPPKRTDTAVARDTLPSTTLIPASAVLRRFLTRLPKSVLVDLVLLWLDNPLSPIHEPDDADDSFFDEEPDQSIEHRREIYEAYKQDNGFSKNAVIDRIFTKEWVCPSFWDFGLYLATWSECISGCDVRHAISVYTSNCSEMALLRASFCKSSCSGICTGTSHAIITTVIISPTTTQISKSLNEKCTLSLVLAELIGSISLFNHILSYRC